MSNNHTPENSSRNVGKRGFLRKKNALPSDAADTKELFYKHWKDAMLSGISLVIAVLLIILFVYSTRFLITSMNSALLVNGKSLQDVHFDIEGLESLGLDVE